MVFDSKIGLVSSCFTNRERVSSTWDISHVGHYSLILIEGERKVGKSYWLNSEIRSKKERLNYDYYYYVDFRAINSIRTYKKVLELHQFLKAKLYIDNKCIVVIDHIEILDNSSKTSFISIINELLKEGDHENISIVLIWNKDAVLRKIELSERTSFYSFAVVEPNYSQRHEYLTQQLGIDKEIGTALQFIGIEKCWLRIQWMSNYINSKSRQCFIHSDIIVQDFQKKKFTGFLSHQIEQVLKQIKGPELDLIYWIFYLCERSKNGYFIAIESIEHLMSDTLKQQLRMLSSGEVGFIDYPNDNSWLEILFPENLKEDEGYISFCKRAQDAINLMTFQSLKGIVKQDVWTKEELNKFKSYDFFYSQRYWFEINQLDYAFYIKKKRKSEELIAMEEQRKLEKKNWNLRRKRWSLGMLIITILGLSSFYIFSLQQRKWLSASQLKTERALKEANENKKLAEESKALTLIEIDKTKQALLQAQISETKAINQQKRAASNAHMARKAESLALDQKLRAIQAEKEAVRAKNEIEKTGFLDLSKALALKSVQERNNIKAIGQLQASYLIQSKLNKENLSNELYQALYYFKKRNDGNDFNILRLKDNGVEILMINGSRYCLTANGKCIEFNHNLKKLKETQLPNLGVFKGASEVPNSSKIVCFGAFNQIVLFDLETEVIKTIKTDLASVDFMVFYDQDYWWAGGDQEVICRENGKKEVKHTFSSRIRSQFCHGETIFLATEDGAVWTVDKDKKAKIAQFKSPVSAFLLHNQQLTMGHENGDISSYNFENKSLNHQWKGHKSRIQKLLASDRNTLISFSLDHSWKMWDIGNVGNALLEIPDVGDWIINGAYDHRSNSVFVLQKNKIISLWPLNVKDWSKDLVKEEDTLGIKEVLGLKWKQLKPYLYNE